MGDGAQMTLAGARISGFAVGIQNGASGTLSVDRSVIAGNRNWGLLNLRTDSCLPATLVYWGRPGGPEDPSDAKDGCMDVAYAGGGDKVSDHVQWWRYAIDEAFTPAEGIGPGVRRVFLPQLLAAGSWR